MIWLSMFPARAGVILAVKLLERWKIDVPRASGGDPSGGDGGEGSRRCSPRSGDDLLLLTLTAIHKAMFPAQRG